MRLARLKEGYPWIAGAVQGDVMMVGSMAEELPLRRGQRILDLGAAANAESCVE
jgi:hypothetical protein